MASVFDSLMHKTQRYTTITLARKQCTDKSTILKDQDGKIFTRPGIEPPLSTRSRLN